ncbi:MAG: hypothetical protein AAFW75_10395 [Cyanobacteria bacterium J06636_16]
MLTRSDSVRSNEAKRNVDAMRLAGGWNFYLLLSIETSLFAATDSDSERI